MRAIFREHANDTKMEGTYIIVAKGLLLEADYEKVRNDFKYACRSIEKKISN